MFGRDLDHPFYRPLWRRILIVAVTAVWFLAELWMGAEPVWTTIAGAFFVYAAYAFLLRGPKAPG